MKFKGTDCFGDPITLNVVVDGDIIKFESPDEDFTFGCTYLDLVNLTLRVSKARLDASGDR